MKPSQFLIVCSLALPFTTANALEDNNSTTIAPHHCKAPKKPENRAEMADYKSAIDAFKNCITSYVKEHSDLAMKYQNLAKINSEAANAAMSDWNKFVTDAMGEQGTDAASQQRSGQ